MAISVGKLGKMFGLSRSTLLYYDAIGLLKPSSRSESKYRLYSEEDVERLRQIVLYRDTGLPLEEIPRLLDADQVSITAVLFKRLDALNREIASIKAQQDIIMRLLKNFKPYLYRNPDREVWAKLVKLAGIEENMMDAWHSQFEHHAPELHEKFLRMLRFTDEEILEMRCHYAKNGIISGNKDKT